jgi:hypothetical protein
MQKETDYYAVGQVGMAFVAVQVHMTMFDAGAESIDHQLKAKASYDEKSGELCIPAVERFGQHMDEGDREKICRAEGQQQPQAAVNQRKPEGDTPSHNNRRCQQQYRNYERIHFRGF